MKYFIPYTSKTSSLRYALIPLMLGIIAFLFIFIVVQIPITFIHELGHALFLKLFCTRAEPANDSIYIKICLSYNKFNPFNKAKMGKTFSNIYESFSLNPKHNKYLIKGSALSGTLFVVYVMYLLQLLFSQNLLLWYFFSSFSFFISFSEIVSFLILSSDFNIFRHPEDFRYDPKNEELYNFSINLS